MTDIPHFLYDGYSLEEKYRWMNSGRGPAAAIAFGAGLRELALAFECSDETIGRKLIERRLGATWEGRAATAAGGALDRAASTAQAFAQAGRSGGDSSHAYGDSFTAAKNAIHRTRAVGTNWWGGEMLDGFGQAMNDAFENTFGIQSDYRERLVAHRAADQAANDALARHEASTRDALAAFQAAAAPAAAPAQPNGSPRQDQVPSGVVREGAGTTAGAGPVAAARGGSGSATVDGRHASGAGDPGDPGGVASAASGVDAHGPEQPSGADRTESAGASPRASPPPPPGTDPTRSGSDRLPLDGALPGGPWTSPASPDARGSAVRYGGGGGGDGPGGAALPPRGGAAAGGADHFGRGPGSGAGPSGGIGSPGPGPGRGSAGVGGGMPMGLGSAAGGTERTHRNQTFIPDDEPFRVEYDFDLAPPVIGASDPDTGR